MGILLGIDFGTTNYKAGLYDEAGRLLGLGSTAPQYTTAADGRVELPVAQFIGLIQGAITEAAADARVSLDRVDGISYSSQANTFLLMDGYGEPLTPLVAWTDHRAKDFQPAYKELAKHPEFLRTVGFNGIAPGMMVANVGWFQAHERATWEKARQILFLPNYFVYLLTGFPVGDSGGCALAGLWDLHQKQWWPEAASAANVPLEMLPPLADPGTTVGETTAAGGELFGLKQGVPVIVGSLDHHVAAIGAGAGRAVKISVSMGTVIAATSLQTIFSPEPEACIGPGMNGNGWYKIVWHNHGTRALNWYRENFAPELTVPELLALAERAKPAVDPPRMELCPWERAWPSGVHHAFTDGHHSADHGLYVRSILTGTTQLLAGMLQKLPSALLPGGIAVSGGGSKSDFWLKMIADQINAPVYRVANEQTGCRGAAALAATGAGFYSSIEEAAEAMVSGEDALSPVS